MRGGGKRHFRHMSRTFGTVRLRRTAEAGGGEAGRRRFRGAPRRSRRESPEIPYFTGVSRRCEVIRNYVSSLRFSPVFPPKKRRRRTGFTHKKEGRFLYKINKKIGKNSTPVQVAQICVPGVRDGRFSTLASFRDVTRTRPGRIPDAPPKKAEKYRICLLTSGPYLLIIITERSCAATRE